MCRPKTISLDAKALWLSYRNLLKRGCHLCVFLHKQIIKIGSIGIMQFCKCSMRPESVFSRFRWIHRDVMLSQRQLRKLVYQTRSRWGWQEDLRKWDSTTDSISLLTLWSDCVTATVVDSKHVCLRSSSWSLDSRFYKFCGNSLTMKLFLFVLCGVRLLRRIRCRTH